MKILIVTNLFPNAEEPTRGMYNLQLVKSLVSLAQLRVVAPVPWYPLRGSPQRASAKEISRRVRILMGWMYIILVT